MTVLLLLHTENDHTLGKPALETATAAQQLAKDLGTPLQIALVGSSLSEPVGQLGGIRAEKVFLAEAPELADSRYATDIQALTVLTDQAQPDFLVAPATSRWSRVLPGLAQRKQAVLDTHATSCAVQAGSVIIERWYYRQRLRTEISRSQRPWYITLAAGVAQPWTAEGDGIQGAETLPVTVTFEATQTTVTGFHRPDVGEQTIRPDADTLFVAGAGWTKKQADGQTHTDKAETLILGFLKQTGASLGSSKSLVDLGSEGEKVLSFLSHLNQVGQTGATPRHVRGLSTCCHGEEPHVVGWRFINERRAINTDPNCGWAQGKADVLYVADAFELMEKVNALLSQ